MKLLRSKVVKGLALSILFSLGISFVAFSQNKISEQPSGFLFSVQKINNGIILKGIEGCAWKELSFTLVSGGTQTIDQYGMVASDSGQINQNGSLANFKLIIKKTKKGIELEGKEGTSFLNLKYSDGKEDRIQLINNNGMVASD